MNAHSNAQAGHIGRSMTVKALGQTWTFSRWTRRIWVEFSEWARTQLPNPLTIAMEAIDAAQVKDAAILRKLEQDDNAEIVKAAAENRPPVLLKPQYKPIADVLIEKAQDQAGKCLDFNSPQFQSVMRSMAGSSYLLFLLLREHHPDVTPDDAYEIMMNMPPSAMGEIHRTTSGTAANASKGKN